MGFHLWYTEELPIEVSFHGGLRWQSSHSVAAGETLSTLATKLRAFRVLFDEFVRLFGLELEETFMCKPELGIQKQFLTYCLPWPDATARTVAAALRALTVRAPVSAARHLARHWP